MAKILLRLLENPPADVQGAPTEDVERAAMQSREMVFTHEFDPI